MPTETVAEFSVERRQVLAPDGSYDEALAPDLPPDALRDLYRTMRLVRRLDERAIALQRRGEIGTYAPAIGQEAAQVGSAFALADDDWIVPSFREHPALISRGLPPSAVLIYAAGLEEGAELPEGAQFLPPAIPVGSQVIHAAGVGWGLALRGDPGVALTYFGDGATSEGDVYEGLNVAGALDAQVVFLCQNNQYAISTPRAKQTRAETLAQKAVAAGFRGVQVDGNDPLGVYSVVRDALDSARAGDPVLVEALTYRRSMHTTADDPSVYRRPEEEADWADRDPVDRLEAHLLATGVLSEGNVDAIGEEIEAELEDAVAEMRAVRDAADPADMFRYAFAAMPPELARQFAAFRREQDGA